jgi:hypothetical protein
MSYFELVEKAKKLKALSEKGYEGERENAKKFYLDFITKHKINESDVDEKKYKRAFYLNGSSYETILSYVILSVNPFSEIEKSDNQYFVKLDDEDFIEVNYKIGIFYDYFLNSLHYIKKIFLFTDNKDESVFLTAFLTKNQSSFEPDEYAWKKFRGSMGKKVNPDVEDKRPESSKDANASEKKTNQKIEKNEEQLEPLTQLDFGRYNEYMKLLKKVVYVRANKTIKNLKNESKWKITD